MNRLNILIVGCGKVGCELARQLMTMKCFNVWGLRRDITRLPAGVHPIPGDLTHPDQLGEWPDRIDYAVYATAADKGTPESYQQAYVTGLGNTLHRLKAGLYSPGRVFFTSSTSVFHQNLGEWVDEASATEPGRFNGQALLKAETLLTQSDLATTAIRFGGIYGPGRNRLIHRVMRGEGCPKEPAVFSNRIHQKDCAGIVAHLIRRDMDGQTVDPLYLGVDHEPAPIHEVIEWLGSQLNITLDHQSPAPQRGNKRCRNQKILDTGYRFYFPDYQAGYRDLLKNEGFL